MDIIVTTKSFSVGYVAKRSGVKVSALHFYEQKGLISSWRNQGNQRRYAPDVLRRIAVIKAAQNVGINLAAIKAALDTLPEQRTPTKEDWQLLSQTWHQALEQKILQLTQLKESLSSCIGCGCLSLNSCPIYNPDDMLAKEGQGAVILDKTISKIKNA